MYDCAAVVVVIVRQCKVTVSNCCSLVVVTGLGKVSIKGFEIGPGPFLHNFVYILLDCIN